MVAKVRPHKVANEYNTQIAFLESRLKEVMAQESEEIIKH